MANISGKAQNIFDCEHSKVFANYLFLTQDYGRAANEYERILFTCDTASVRPKLLKAYRLSGQYALSFRQINRLYPVVEQAPVFVRDEYLKLLLLSAQYTKADSVLKVWQFPQSHTQQFQLQISLLTNQWKKADRQLAVNDSIEVFNRTELIALTQQAQSTKYKSSFLAATLSTVVPGLGKFYTGDRKDGLVSLVFVGSLAFQAYRAFRRNGETSVAGWLFAGVGLGFYVGNIYGSVKSARQYNQRRLNQLHNEAKRLTFLSF